MTTVTSHHPVRTDAPLASAGPTRPPRLWALAGLGAGLAGAGTIVTSGLVDVVYREEFAGTTDGIAAALHDKAPVLFAFHSLTAASAVLMVLFGAGLFRRLQRVTDDSIAPLVAFAGLAGTAVVSILGTGLSTEFMVSTTSDVPGFADSSGAMFNHWVATIPWLWTLTGLAGLGVYAAARRGGVPRWLGRVGLVLGGLTVVVGISPFEYMAGATGVLWLLITSTGFLLGDRDRA